MKKFIALSISLLFVSAAPALAASGYVTKKVSMYAGPDKDYPVVDKVSKGEPVDIRGCISGLRWCEVVSKSDRGWIEADDLRYATGSRRSTVTQYYSNGDVRVIVFDTVPYWDRYYRTKYFYKDRYKWRDRHHNYNHHHDDDDHDRTPPRVEEKPKPPQGPDAKAAQPMPRREDSYDPACPIGVKNC